MIFISTCNDKMSNGRLRCMNIDRRIWVKYSWSVNSLSPYICLATALICFRLLVQIFKEILLTFEAFRLGTQNKLKT